jgi:hypothetical protein
VFFVDRDVYRNFFIAVVIAAFIYMQTQKSEKTKKATQDSEALFVLIEADMKDHAFIFPKIYSLHKPPKKLQYLRKDSKIANIIYDLRKLRVYDNVSYVSMVVLIEYFLKLHFNIILGKYNADIYDQMIVDVRTEILNTMHAMLFNLPKKSTVISVPGDDVEEFLYDKILEMSSVTDTYVKILRNKFKDRAFKLSHYPVPDDNKEVRFELL